YYQFFAFLNNADEPTIELPTPEQARQRNRVKAEITAVEKMLKILDDTSPEKMEEWENNLTTELRKQLPRDVQAALEVVPNARTNKQKQVLVDAYRKTDQARHLTGLFGTLNPFAAAAYLNTALARSSLDKRLTALKKNVPAVTTTMVMQERKAP